MTEKSIKMRVIDHYDKELGRYVEEDHDVHVCYIRVRYVNSNGNPVIMNLTASEFLEQYTLVKK